MSAEQLIETEGGMVLPVDVKNAETRTLQRVPTSNNGTLINCTTFASILHNHEVGEDRRVYTLGCGILIVPDDDEEDPLAELGEFREALEDMEPGEVPALADGGVDTDTHE